MIVLSEGISTVMDWPRHEDWDVRHFPAAQMFICPGEILMLLCLKASCFVDGVSSTGARPHLMPEIPDFRRLS